MQKNRISWDDYFMKTAFLVAERSVCTRHHVGAVIVKNNRILTTGYNGMIKKFPHCTDIGCLRDELAIPSGKDGHLCRAVHAEMNAINQAASSGISIENSVLYVTHSPCSWCIKSVINAGISKVFYAIAFPADVIHEEISENSPSFIIKKVDPPDLSIKIKP